MKKTVLFIFCVFSAGSFLLSGCFWNGGGESVADDIIEVQEDEIVLEPEELEIDVDDDGTGDINNPESMTDQDYIEMAEAANDLLAEMGQKDGKVKGSCNLIAAKSTCVDFTGSWWVDFEKIKLHCSDAGAIVSKDTCPYGAVGGCKPGPGTITEQIIWMYCEGGDPVCGENIKYTQMACDANPLGEWTLQP